MWAEVAIPWTLCLLGSVPWFHCGRCIIVWIGYRVNITSNSWVLSGITIALQFLFWRPCEDTLFSQPMDLSHSTVSLLATVNSCRYICGFFSCECWYEAIHVYEIVNKRRCNFLHCQIHVGTLCNFCVMFCLFLWYLALINMFVSPVHTWTDFWLVHLLEEIFTYMDYVVQHACSVTELQSR